MTGDDCLVCQQPTKSLHFQVNCCRACAAFFRRSVKTKFVYRCQRGTGRCALNSRSKSKPLCRYCRMKRCHEIGMRIDADIDNISTSTIASSTNSPEQPLIDQFTSSSISMNGKKIAYDPKSLLAFIKENIVKDTTQSFKNAAGVVLSPLQRMSHELAKFLSQKAPDPKTVDVSMEVNVPNNIRFHEDFIVGLVRVVTTCEAFVELDNNQKFEIFRHFWSTFLWIERTYQAINVLGSNEEDMRILLNNFHAIDLKLIFKVPHDDEPEQVKMTRPLVERTFRYIVGPMKSLKLTIFEISYIALNLLWSLHDLNGISTEAYKKAEEILERNAAEMHSYYVYEMKLPNYAARLAAVTRLVLGTETTLRCKKDLIIMGKFFDLFEVDIFDCMLAD